MTPEIHGTIDVPGRQHPVLDIGRWEREFPLADDERARGSWIDQPGELAIREQAVRRASAKGSLGPAVAADVFVWSSKGRRDRPWLTRLGGCPWRPKGKPWPRDKDGIPLAFLGQICFADSTDILPCELPGAVALIFGTFTAGWVFSLDMGSALEWSPLQIEEPADMIGAPWTGELPFVYHGVLHRTLQYFEHTKAEVPFKELGYANGGFGVYSVQATSIGPYAHLPQGWPFSGDDGHKLIATLSSFYFRGKWPLCDVPRGLQIVDGDGSVREMGFGGGRDFGIGDAGAIWIYRDDEGEFRLDGACG